MKPKDLKPLFSWEERRPYLDRGIFYIPHFYFQHACFALPAWENLFLNANPVSVEFCSGNGAWILEKAKNAPGHNWIAVEKRFDRVQKIWSKMQNQGLKNLFIVCGKAETFLAHYVADGSFSDAYVNFPDPWPKEKHKKHRLVHPEFMLHLFRILKNRGTCSVVTDDPHYRDASINLLMQKFVTCFPPPFFVTEVPDYGKSYFEMLWREKGKPIFYMKMQKFF